MVADQTDAESKYCRNNNQGLPQVSYRRLKCAVPVGVRNERESERGKNANLDGYQEESRAGSCSAPPIDQLKISFAEFVVLRLYGLQVSSFTQRASLYP